ncbi:MAG: Gfo/Idh/MocA family oxidoreductase, partial [candidate division Zixibacteria bacterium]|nr:Gfo/Idh/MocA family oxidoreductase [candidate division Zixibacteria bacterium]
HAKILSRMEECDYTGIADFDPQAEEIAKQLGTRFYEDYKEMIDKERPDGVAISVPNELHESIGCFCLQRGVHVFMEKPIASTISEAQALIESARESNVKLLIGHHRRFNPMVNATKEMIKKGELGDLVGISVLWAMYKPSEYFVAGEWRKKKGGGPVLINTIHEIDDLRYMYGEIERVYAEVSNKTRKFEVEDTVCATVRFKDGVLASILMSDTAPSLWGYEATMGENKFFYKTNGDIYHFLGNKASLTFPGMVKVCYADPSKMGWQYPLTTEHLDIKSSDPYPEQMSHFCRVIRGEEKPRTSGEDALRTLRGISAIIESVEKRKPITVDYSP